MTSTEYWRYRLWKGKSIAWIERSIPHPHIQATMDVSQRSQRHETALIDNEWISGTKGLRANPVRTAFNTLNDNKLSFILKMRLKIRQIRIFYVRRLC